MSNLLFEPFKIKSVEELPLATRDERVRWIHEAHYNVFNLRSEQVTIDLLTDSGTGAMSDKQWAAMLTGDEAYAGSRSFFELEATVQSLTGLPYFIPTHQGRMAEHLVASVLLKGGEVIPSNGLFDTTLANVLDRGAEGLNLTAPEGMDPFLSHPFKGNIDLQRLEDLLASRGSAVPFIVLTITNNTCGGQPVSLENLERAAAIARRYGKLVLLDACRFAENALFIKRHEAGMANHSVRDIARRCFEVADIVTFSGKKDALANIGGFLCVRDFDLSEKLKARMLLAEGFPSYGGLAGYSLAAMNQGLKEVLDERYLTYRLRTIEWVVERLVQKAVPVLRPAGGHAVYIESSKFFPQIPREQFPGLALTTALFEEGGIRACELGSVAFGRRDAQGNHVLPPLDLVRLAIPRRTYTEAHMGHVVETIQGIFENAQSYSGFRFIHESPVLRHFRSTFERA